MLQRALVIAALTALPASVLAEHPAPFDEQTLDRIQELNRAITDDYERLESLVGDLDERRAVAMSHVEGPLVHSRFPPSSVSTLRGVRAPGSGS